MNRDYCNKECPIGIKASAEFLEKNNSAYDAALDFLWFTETCFEACKYKEKHIEENTR